VGVSYDKEGHAVNTGRWLNGRYSGPAVTLSPGAPSPAAARDRPRRRAFLVGVDAYTSIAPLKGCVNDTADMQRALQSVGFVCTVHCNPTRERLWTEFNTFVGSLRNEDEVFIHFSGHGGEAHKVLYLMPADYPADWALDDAAHLAPPQMREENERRAVSHEQMIEQLGRQADHLTIVMVLDCCRYDGTNHTYKELAREREAESAAPGRALARPPGGASASVPKARRVTANRFCYMYACDPGTVAFEVQNRGAFTRCFVEALHRCPAGLPLSKLFGRASVAMRAQTAGRQMPWKESNGDIDDYELKPAAAAAAGPSSPTAAAASAMGASVAPSAASPGSPSTR